MVLSPLISRAFSPVCWLRLTVAVSEQDVLSFSQERGQSLSNGEDRQAQEQAQVAASISYQVAFSVEIVITEPTIMTCELERERHHYVINCTFSFFYEELDKLYSL